MPVRHVDDPETGERLLTVAEVADLAGVKPDTIHVYRHRGSITDPDYVVGRTPLWRQSTVRRWLDSQ